MKYSIICLIFLTLLFLQCSNKQKTERVRSDKVAEVFFPDGSLRSSVPLKDGKEEGLSIEYYKGGKKYREIEYKNGLKNGLLKKYYRNGELSEETKYENDKKNGVQKKFTKQGKLHSEAIFIDDIPCIGLKEYLPDGSLRKEYPQLVITPVDKILENGTYSLQLSLTDKSKVQYFTGNLVDGKYIDEKAEPVMFAGNGIGEIEYQVFKGTFIMKKINVIAKIKTVPLGNDYIIQRSYNVAVENR